MLGSTMISRICKGFVNLIKGSFCWLINIPLFFKTGLIDFKNYIADFRYKLTHLAESNFELGLYHLKHNNLNDAVLRFKLVDKFFKKNDPENSYWLGVTYYLKSDIKKSIEYLQKSGDKEALIFKDFLQNIDHVSQIPFVIWNQHRDLIAKRIEIENPIFQLENISNIVKIIMSAITDLPNDYKILEIGSNVGFVGEEIKKRFPDNAHLLGIESSEKMLQELENYAAEFYDKTLLDQEYKILNGTKEKFDIIMSCCGISYSRNLDNIFKHISDKLNAGGYFALCIRSESESKMSLIKKEFCYNEADIINSLQKNHFETLHEEKLTLEKNNNYTIFVSRKRGE